MFIEAWGIHNWFEIGIIMAFFWAWKGTHTFAYRSSTLFDSPILPNKLTQKINCQWYDSNHGPPEWQAGVNTTRPCTPLTLEVSLFWSLFLFFSQFYPSSRPLTIFLFSPSFRNKKIHIKSSVVVYVPQLNKNQCIITTV